MSQTGSARRLSREARRAQLVAIGRELVARGSFDDLSTDEVASRAGISRSLLFHYFESREDFLLALAEDAAEELLNATETDPELAPLERLRAGLEAYVDYVERHRDTYLALVRGAAGAGTGIQEVFERTRQIQTERILDGLDLDEEPSAPLVLLVRGYVALVEEVTVAWLDEDDVLRTDLLQLLVDAAAAVAIAGGAPPEALADEVPRR